MIMKLFTDKKRILTDDLSQRFVMSSPTKTKNFHYLRLNIDYAFSTREAH